MLQRIFLFLPAFIILIACAPKKPETLFSEQLPEQTGITFQNTVTQSGDDNVLNYPYFFNGGGVAVGDINNDGLADVYFSGNQVPNKLYLNKGDFTFEDITDKAGVASVAGWKTGVTMADVNQDGLLDIYVCRSAMSDSTLRKNQLFINQGNATFQDKASEYGVADASYSTHAAFFDYDRDGDIDLFVLNHSLPRYAGFSNVLGDLKNQRGHGFGSKLYRNDNGHFTNVSDAAGMVNNVLSFGLGVAVSDVNQDGWPDLYVSNDFNEEDYLYINQHDGTFKNVIKEATGHVSLFSMGSDIADINNDALADIYTLDMLPETNERIKLSSGDDNYDKYNLLVRAGFHRQSMRNMLQLNNGDGTFAEVGQLAGLSNTDWSWSALLADFDGDGWKDAFVSNGYEKDYTNMQFLKYTVDEQMKARETGVTPRVDEILNNMPAIEVGNYFFKNNGNLTFTKTTTAWGIDRRYKSNGAAYADLDNDGDLDLLVNTMNQPAVVYRNNTEGKNFLVVDLHKQNTARVVTGTKIYASSHGVTQYFELSPVRGFQSCMDVPLSISADSLTQFDSVRVVWPDDKTQLFTNVSTKTVLTPDYKNATATFYYPAAEKSLFNPVTVATWTHAPADVNDFKKQLLLPKMYSYSGPKMAAGDVNGDGFGDFYVCGPRGQSGALFVQDAKGNFSARASKVFQQDAVYQDEDATLFDADGDGDLDLYVVSGGYLMHDNPTLLQDRLYLNDGKGNFTKSNASLPKENYAGTCVVALDIDNDKDMDLYVGSGITPGQYPLADTSLFLINDGRSHFTDNIHTKAPALEHAGMATSALAQDLNDDGQMDLVVTGEWMPISIFINQKGTLTDQSAAWKTQGLTGWWNELAAADFDSDGDVDLVAGNYGLNHQYNVSPDRPATLVYKDFNNDNQVDPFFCYYRGGTAYPYASRDEALGQVAFLKPRFPDYTAYANTTLQALFKTGELENVQTLTARELATVYLENNGGYFEKHVLPLPAQFSTAHAIAASDIDGDGDKDLVIGGNDTYMRVRIGECDASRGLVLLNDGKANFTALSKQRGGLNLVGDTRDLVFVPSPRGSVLVVGANGRPLAGYTSN